MAVTELARAAETQRGTDSRTRILDAAMRCFAEDGFEGASIRQIAQKAGVKYQLITYYFRTKDELWDAAMEADLQRFTRRIAVVRERMEDLTPREHFKYFIRTLAEQLARRGFIACIGIQLALHDRMRSELSPRYRRMLEMYIARYLAPVREILASAQQAGIIRDVPLDDMLYLINGAVTYRIVMSAESAYIAGASARDPDTVEAHINAIIKVFLVEPDAPTRRRDADAAAMEV